SARELNNAIKRVLHENQIFRIDHYLGKETGENILTFRFANSIFEPIFNRTHVHHIRIKVAETIGMEGRRGGYYDRAGALRDTVGVPCVRIIIGTGNQTPDLLPSIEIQFNQPPMCLFRYFEECPPNPTSLFIRIQPNEGITLSFECKQPGARFAVQDVKMDFS